MSLHLYNTLSRVTEELLPITPPEVTVYTCGPTVYDYPHIGNWFTFIRYDALIRTLKLSGLNPKWVINITDVGHLVSDADDGEDKIEKGARREHKSAWEIASYYSENFLSGLKKLNFTQPYALPKATEHIKEQIDMIQTLVDKEYAYIIEDGVYFNTEKFEGYENFAQLDLDDLQEGARVAPNPQKKHHADFALWKFSPASDKRDMEWESPWGKGFPGWHIECSAMAKEYLGDTIDIHAGGIDHIPVHHTNEIAQSESANGVRFANYWMHANHITINDQKISKSLGNGITLEDIEKRGFSSMALRLHVLESHYRSQSKFSWDSIEASQNRLNRFYNFAARRFQNVPSSKEIDHKKVLPPEQALLPILQHDLDTPKVLSTLESYMDMVDNQNLSDNTYMLEKYVKFIDDAFGLDLGLVTDLTLEQKELLEQRAKARADKDWPVSDALRSKLEESGIGVRDDQNGQIWYRI